MQKGQKFGWRFAPDLSSRLMMVTHYDSWKVQRDFYTPKYYLLQMDSWNLANPHSKLDPFWPILIRKYKEWFNHFYIFGPTDSQNLGWNPGWCWTPPGFERATLQLVTCLANIETWMLETSRNLLKKGGKDLTLTPISTLPFTQKSIWVVNISSCIKSLPLPKVKIRQWLKSPVSRISSFFPWPLTNLSLICCISFFPIFFTLVCC